MPIGMDQHTGQRIFGLDEIKQRIERVLGTRRLALVGARFYGSNLPELIDKKVNPQFDVSVFAETAVALADPKNGLVDDFVLKRVFVEHSDGVTSLALEGVYLVEGREVVIDGVEVQ